MLDEQADRQHRQSEGADVVEGAVDQLSADALSLQRGVDLGVSEQDLAVGALVLEESGELGAVADLVAMLLGLSRTVVVTRWPFA